MKVHLTRQPDPVELADLERDDDVAIIGTTPSGKRFVAPRRSIGTTDPPYRVYLNDGTALRLIAPSFEEMEAWLLDGDSDEIVIAYETGRQSSLGRMEVRSLLSAMPNGDEPVRTSEPH